MYFNPNPNFDENQWIINIIRTLEHELEDDNDISVSIFSVPKTLMASDPASYTPQEVAIGPYHYLRPELYEMERCKLVAAKRARKQLHGDLKFQYVVDQLEELDLQIRACYHKFLNFSNNTLAWMMAIDAFFLLEFLHIYSMKEGTKAAHNAILRDLIMLENQIPLIVLRKVLEVQYSSLESADEILQVMLMKFCQDISPFKMKKDKPMIQFTECAHLLDCLYNTIVPKAEQEAEITELNDQGRAMQPQELHLDGPIKRLFSKLWNLLLRLNKGPMAIGLIKKLIIVSKPVKVLFKLPWKTLSSLPIFPQDAKEKKSDDESSINKPPLVEEITIPSVTELAKSNVRFSATVGNISTASLDTKKATLHLPTISLDVNTEVILRNLVAYEASNASGPLVLTRYTEMMNGIIDTEEDAKLLREKGIIVNRLKSDAEVANLWNGMNKSIKMTKVPHLDMLIADVNKYYNNRWKVKFGKCMKLYVFGSWQFLTLIAAIMILLLTTLQAFCSVYNCRKFNLGSNSE